MCIILQLIFNYLYSHSNVHIVLTLFSSQSQVRTNYYVDTTKIDWDEDYFSRFVHHNPTTDPGLGLFQNSNGTFDIPVIGPNIVSIEKKTLHPLQKRYYMESGYDEDYVICPTKQSILTGDIPLPFRVNHSQFHYTHKLIWEPHALDYPHSHYVLKGIKHVVSGKEISFDYNYGSVIYIINFLI